MSGDDTSAAVSSGPGAVAHDGSGAAITVPDAEALYRRLQVGVRGLLGGSERTRLVGIVSGGAWLAARLQRDLALAAGDCGVITSALHRDDFAQRGMAGRGAQTSLPFSIEGADLLLIDDVLHTGRTIRAVLNELYDFGRPARVRLAVLVDRNGRELPVQADFSALSGVALPPGRTLALTRDASSDAFGFRVEQETKKP